jgi:hypothetical protein
MKEASPFPLIRESDILPIKFIVFRITKAAQIKDKSVSGAAILSTWSFTKFVAYLSIVQFLPIKTFVLAICWGTDRLRLLLDFIDVINKKHAQTT